MKTAEILKQLIDKTVLIVTLLTKKAQASYAYRLALFVKISLTLND
ncbi:hypothetical protein L4D09_25640 [Photobacterium makurazakiensis]